VRRHLTAGALGIAALVLCAAPAAHGQRADVTLGSTEAELTPADAGGGIAQISLTNLTTLGVNVTARPQRPTRASCTIDLDKSGSLPPAQTRSFTATLSAACGQIKNRFGIIVTAGGKDLQPVTAAVEPKPKTPDWDTLQKWFLLSTLAAIGLMIAVLIVAWIKGTRPWDSLPSLDDSWSFKDSWVSNVTVVGGLLAGIFGSSDVLTGVLGDDADESLALATIGGAVAVALIGAAGVSLGVATARFARPGSAAWSVVGGAAGGLLVGAFGKLLGLDAFTLLVGRSPGNITGGSEGAVIGAAVGLAGALALRGSSVRRGAFLGAALGGAAGVAIVLAGGRLMLGSLELLISGFPNSRLRLDQLSHPFANDGLNRLVHLFAGGVETALFAGYVVGAMMLAWRRLAKSD